MNKIFALCGKPGSGKSYAANEIVKHYKSTVFSIDKIMLKLFGEIEGRELFLNKLNTCKEIIYEISDSILENSNGSIIFDYGFWTKADREHLRKRFTKYNVLFIYTNTDDNIRWERIKERNKNNNQSNYIFDKETFEYLSKLFEDFSEDEEYITYDNMDKLLVEINTMDNLRKDIIREYFESWINKDINIIEKYFASDIKYIECYGPEYNGINQIRQWFTDWNRGNSVLEWNIKRFFVYNNIVVVEWFFKCEYDKNTGSFDGVSIIEFNENNKILSVQEFQSKPEHIFPYE